MPHGHILSAASESMQRDAFRSRKTVSGVALRWKQSDCSLLFLTLIITGSWKRKAFCFHVRHKRVQNSCYGKGATALSVFLFWISVPDPTEHCRQHWLPKAFSTRNFHLPKSKWKFGWENAYVKALLCLLSFVIERPLDGNNDALTCSVFWLFSR